MNKYMQIAIDEAREGIHAGHGGPFGSVIIKDGKFDRMFGTREAFSEYLEETDRDACLDLFEEYKAIDAKRY